MVILITGYSGMIGQELVKKLAKNNKLILLSRSKKSDNFTYQEMDKIVSLYPKIDSVINLAGENIGSKRWSQSQKDKIFNSRKETLDWIEELSNKIIIKKVISSSAIGIYQKNLDDIITETSPIDHDFLSKVCNMIEEKTINIKSEQKHIVRTGVVLSKKDGALKKMLLPFKLGIGGTIGDGSHYMSWISLDDITDLYVKLSSENSLPTIINGVANYCSNKDFTKALGFALHKPTFLPVPKFMIKVIFGEMSKIILDSQKIDSLYKNFKDKNIYNFLSNEFK